MSETIQSLTHHGVRKVIVVNGHGGNTAALEEACARLTRDEDLFAVEWEWFDDADHEVGHGGEAETSMMLYLESELVGKPVKGDSESWGKYVNGASVAYDTEQFTENGITGDARDASSEFGEKLFDESFDDLTGLVDWMRAHDPDK